MEPKDHAALEALVVDNPDLEALEARLARFNLFEASGLVRQEIRHSNFLAFLLDPAQPHGLGDTFLRWLLADTLGRGDAQALHALSPLDLHLSDLSGSVVRREWRNIDILIENPPLGLVVAIENKIGIGEHSDQLRRYREALLREFPNAKHRVLILLSPEAIRPSDDGYLAVGYETVYALLGKALNRLGSQLSPDVGLVLRHYKELLATHVIDDPELDKLCDAIYCKHKKALDLIFERTSRPYELAGRAVQSWIADHLDEVVPNQMQKAYVSFVPKAWLAFSPIVGKESGKDRYSLSVLVANSEKKAQLSIELYLGSDEYRNRLRGIASESPKLFPGLPKKKGNKFSMLYKGPLIEFDEDLGDGSLSIDSKIRDMLDLYMKSRLPEQTAALQAGLQGTEWSSKE